MRPSSPRVSFEQVSAIRGFNRLYTRRVGLLNEGHLESRYSLTEVRILFELARRGGCAAVDLCRGTGLDPGYLSRILGRFSRRGWLQRRRSQTDARQVRLALTPRGRAAFSPLDRRASQQVREMIAPLAPADRERLVSAAQVMERLLGGGHGAHSAIRLRRHRPGDMGWVTYRHGALYHQEYGWDERFEALVAEIVAEFVRNFDPLRERCWIAERDGEIVGSVFVVRKTDTVAKLRLLLVEPSARGLGVGRRLVDQCVQFARRAGYQKLTLWTQSCLVAARSIYEKAGLRKVAEEPHHSFGHDLVAETWNLDL